MIPFGPGTVVRFPQWLYSTLGARGPGLASFNPSVGNDLKGRRLTNSKPTVLLGAGASADAGVPMAAGLTKSALDDVPRDAYPGRRDERLAPALAFVVNAIQRHALASGKSDADKLALPGIELVVSAVAMLHDRPALEISAFIGSWDPVVSMIDPLRRRVDGSRFKAFIDDVAKSLGSPFGANSQKFSDALDSYMSSTSMSVGTFGELRDWLLDQVVRDVSKFTIDDTVYLDPLVNWAFNSETTVATLNYDRCIEESANRCSIAVDRAVDSWAATGRLSTKSSRSLRLLKLHGSVDWEFRGERFTAETASKLDYYTPRQPGIIYGQRGKLRADGPFLQLLEAFRQELNESSTLVAVGYSFGDSHINAILEGWLSRNVKRTVFIVDPFFPNYPKAGYPGRYPDDLRRQFWEGFGPGRPVPKPEGFNGGQSQVRPLPSQFVPMRTKTSEFSAALATHGIDEIIEKYREDPELEWGWVNYDPV